MYNCIMMYNNRILYYGSACIHCSSQWRSINVRIEELYYNQAYKQHFEFCTTIGIFCSDWALVQTVKIIISQTTVNQNRTLTISQSQYILSNDTQKSLLLHQKQAPLLSGNETRGLTLLNLRRSLDISTRNDNYKWTNAKKIESRHVKLQLRM